MHRFQQSMHSRITLLNCDICITCTHKSESAPTLNQFVGEILFWNLIKIEKFLNECNCKWRQKLEIYSICIYGFFKFQCDVNLSNNQYAATNGAGLPKTEILIRMNIKTHTPYTHTVQSIHKKHKWYRLDCCHNTNEYEFFVHCRVLQSVSNYVTVNVITITQLVKHNSLLSVFLTLHVHTCIDKNITCILLSVNFYIIVTADMIIIYGETELGC